jgi:hypothetical protein
MKKLALLPLLASLALALPSQAQQVSFGRTQLMAGMHVIQAETAISNAQRRQGLMFREQMPTNAGMVFVFDTPPSVQCMWMKNTLIPLSVAFIDEQGTIVNIEDMQPKSLDNHCSTKPVKYALEMNLGWFAQKHVKPGAKISGLPGLNGK